VQTEYECHGSTARILWGTTNPERLHSASRELREIGLDLSLLLQFSRWSLSRRWLRDGSDNGLPVVSLENFRQRTIATQRAILLGLALYRKDGYRARPPASLFGVIHVTNAVLPAMRDRKAGH
jgi:hypothetical protein